MWERYYKLRSSKSYVDLWIDVLKQVDFEGGPIFYQFVTDFLMEQLIKLRYSVVVETNDEEVTLDKEESSALRYCAGYMIRSLLKKVGRSKHKQKDELKKCLAEMTKEPKESTHNSTDWIKVAHYRKQEVALPLYNYIHTLCMKFIVSRPWRE